MRVGHAGALHYSVLQSRKSNVFGRLLEWKIAFLVLSLQPLARPDHSMHVKHYSASSINTSIQHRVNTVYPGLRQNAENSTHLSGAW